MKKQNFKILPVIRYKRACYPSMSGESCIARACWLSYFFPKKIVRGMVALLLFAGLSLGAGGCDDDAVKEKPGMNVSVDGDSDTDRINDADLDVDSDTDRVNDADLDVDSDSDYFNDNDNSNTLIRFTCLDSTRVTLDYNDGSETGDCMDICVECCENCFEQNFGSIEYDELFCEGVTHNFGWYDYEPWISLAWCDQEADQPCQCMYDSVPGVMHECCPEDMFCAGPDKLTFCTDGEMFSGLKCRDYCLAFFGPEYTPCICSEADLDNICGCATSHEGRDCSEPENSCYRDNPYTEYTYSCVDDLNAFGCWENEKREIDCLSVCNGHLEDAICDTIWYSRYEYINGDYVTRASCGSGCRCEYAYLHDNPPECTPGETRCSESDASQIMICTDNERFSTIPCRGYCRWQHGPGYVSAGVCDENNPENLCACTLENQTDGDAEMD